MADLFARLKLNWKILGILTLALAGPMVTMTYIVASHQARDMINQLTRFGDEVMHMVYSGIQYPMAVGDSASVRGQLLSMEEKMPGIEVLISNPEQVITYATSAEMIGRKVDGAVYDQNYWQQLTGRAYNGDDKQISFEDEIAGARYLTMVRLIANKTKCHQCHGETKPYLGNMVVRMSTDEIYREIHSHANTNIMLGIMGIMVVIAIAYLLFQDLLTRPIVRLAKEMKMLPEYFARGDYSLQVATARRDEIGDLEQAFNQMVADLKEKKILIEQTNKNLAEANKELEAFAYSVSHDLRAPLRNIDGFSKILLDDYQGKLDEMGVHYLNRVRNGANKMSTLIDDMLTFSRAGRVELRLKAVEANKLVNNALRDFSEVIKERDITVKVGELPVVLCDPAMIENVFRNLFSNAIKYSREASHAKVVVDYDDGTGAIRVKDNGIGFDMEYHEKIFQVFQRLQLPEDYEGTGIGLAVVRRIVERHRGKIWAESAPGEGATFFVKLPLDE